MILKDYQRLELQCWLSLKDVNMSIVKEAVEVLVSNQNENMRYLEASVQELAIINIEEVGTI